MGKFTVDGQTLKGSGALDTRHIAEFDSAARELVDSTDTDVTVDFTEVQYMTSAFLGLLMSLRSELAEQKRGIVMRASPTVKNLLRMTGLDTQMVVRD